MPGPFLLPKVSYKWALTHLSVEGDTDILPRMLEIDAIKYCWSDLIGPLAKLDLNNYDWHGFRKFLVPKERFAFRIATQLDPFDNIVLAAIVRKFGHKIEARRIPRDQKRVFSYRFKPSDDGRFYDDPESWHSFWRESAAKAENLPAGGWVAILDIADYYNQIYHHVLENQLIDARVPKEACRLLMSLIKDCTQTVSRGIPVGPHSMHLLAECALIPTDNSLLAKGLDFCRYVDDIHIFCPTEQAAEIAVYDVANILDTQQKLMLQRQKTRILPATEFIQLAHRMLADNPINPEENDLLNLIGHYAANPYVNFSYNRLTPDDQKLVAPEKLAKILAAHFADEPVNYNRLRWLLRRLTQGGIPGAVDYVLGNINLLTPALGDVARYLVAAGNNYTGDWNQAGTLIINALEHPVVRHNDYIQIVLLHLFSRMPQLDHIHELAACYANTTPLVRREIVIAAGAARLGDWVRERKDDFSIGDPWLKRAILYSMVSLPGDEATHWLRNVKRRLSTLEKIVLRWTFLDKRDSLKLGQLTL